MYNIVSDNSDVLKTDWSACMTFYMLCSNKRVKRHSETQILEECWQDVGKKVLLAVSDWHNLLFCDGGQRFCNISGITSLSHILVRDFQKKQLLEQLKIINIWCPRMWSDFFKRRGWTKKKPSNWSLFNLYVVFCRMFPSGFGFKRQ